MSRLEVMYSCHECGLVDAKVEVKPRGEEDVVTWVKSIMYELCFDHGLRSPDCRPKELKDIKIPIGEKGREVERIGDVPEEGRP